MLILHFSSYYFGTTAKVVGMYILVDDIGTNTNVAEMNTLLNSNNILVPNKVLLTGMQNVGCTISATFNTINQGNRLIPTVPQPTAVGDVGDGGVEYIIFY